MVTLCASSHNIFLLKKNTCASCLAFYPSYCSPAASWYKEDVMTLLDETLKSGGLTTSSDSYTINGEPGDFYLCSKGKNLINDN